MRNLYDETIYILKKHNKTWEDIKFISCPRMIDYGEYDTPVELDLYLFSVWAKSYDYNNDFGHQEVHPLLLIVGLDWWLERHEYDGSEWWEFKTLPIRPNSICSNEDDFKSVISHELPDDGDED